MARDIYYDYTNQIEPFGIDEAWLDVTGNTLFASAEEVAEDIRKRIKATDFILATDPVQLDFFADNQRSEKDEKIEKTVDTLRQRFGPFAVQRAVVLQDTRLTGFAPKTDHVIHPVSYF